MTEVACSEERVEWALGVGEEAGGLRERTAVLMSRRRSSGPPWSAPRPPGPGHPWS